MPRWASRITLRITDVRVERVQSISEHDAIAEGLESRSDEEIGYVEWGLIDAKGWGWSSYPTVAYAGLWDSINGKKPGASWAANPWVWVVEFERPVYSRAVSLATTTPNGLPPPQARRMHPPRAAGSAQQPSDLWPLLLALYQSSPIARECWREEIAHSGAPKAPTNPPHTKAKKSS